MITEELWKDIPGYENLYKISNFGRLIGLVVNKIKTPILENNILYISLWKNNQETRHRLNRFMMQMFGIDKKLKILYKDGNMYNNHIDNLEYEKEIDGEIWKPIQNFGKYYISSMGRVKNMDTLDYINPYEGKIILALGNKKQKTFSLPRLVAEHFLNRGNFEKVRHINNDQNDCRSQNLEWYHEAEPLNLEGEIWKLIPDLYRDIYHISNYGRIKTFSGMNGISERILRNQYTQFGHNQFRCRSVMGERISLKVHRLVAILFNLPNPNNLPCVGHVDDNPSNNHINNLYWTTSEDNTRKAHLNNRIKHAKGEDGGMSKFTNQQVIEIREKYKNTPNMTINRFAKGYGVTGTTMYKIIKGISYSNI